MKKNKIYDPFGRGPKLLFIMKATDAMGLLAEDTTTKYPVWISSNAEHEVGMWKFRNAEELLDFIPSREVQKKNITSIYEKDGETFMDVAYNGAIYPLSDDEEFVNSSRSIAHAKALSNTMIFYTKEPWKYASNINLKNAIYVTPAGERAIAEREKETTL